MCAVYEVACCVVRSKAGSFMEKYPRLRNKGFFFVFYKNSFNLI